MLKMTIDQLRFPGARLVQTSVLIKQYSWFQESDYAKKINFAWNGAALKTYRFIFVAKHEW